MSSFQLAKEINSKKIIRLIREKGPISRVDISELTGIPQPTITRITEELLKIDLIRETGLTPTSRGRRPILLSFNATWRFAVGVQLGGSTIRVALTDLNGNRIASRQTASSSFATLSAAAAFIDSSIRETMEETGIDPSRLLGVGVGVPGPLNETPEGRLTVPRLRVDTSVPLRDMLKYRSDLPVLIDNNSNVAALAEKWFGRGIGYRNFVYVLAELGIGSGLVLGGQLMRGAHGESGEIGHTTIDLDGERCDCGNRGCLETLVSIPRIEAAVRSGLSRDFGEELPLFGQRPEAVTFDDIVRALQQGSRLAKQALEDAGHHLGVGIANTINLLNPEVVIVGGKLGMSSPVLIEAVQSAVRSRVLSEKGKRTPVVASNLEDAVVLGAAALVIDDAFSFFSVL